MYVSLLLPSWGLCEPLCCNLGRGWLHLGPIFLESRGYEAWLACSWSLVAGGMSYIARLLKATWAQKPQNADFPQVFQGFLLSLLVGQLRLTAIFEANLSPRGQNVDFPIVVPTYAADPGLSPPCLRLVSGLTPSGG